MRYRVSKGLWEEVRETGKGGEAYNLGEKYGENQVRVRVRKREREMGSYKL